jgi:nicotinamidase/pyrazinamidase
MTNSETGTQITLDTRTALIVVDFQNDFVDPRGSLFVAGEDAAAGEVAALMAEARSADAFVVCTQDWHPEITPHFKEYGGVWPRHCVAGTWGAELHPGIRHAGPVVRKGTAAEDGYSAFGSRSLITDEVVRTGLDALLAEHGISRVVVAGLALDVCVLATALDANRLGFATAVVRQATRAVNLKPGDGDRAVAEMRAVGVRVT